MRPPSTYYSGSGSARAAVVLPPKVIPAWETLIGPFVAFDAAPCVAIHPATARRVAFGFFLGVEDEQWRVVVDDRLPEGRRPAGSQRVAERLLAAWLGATTGEARARFRRTLNDVSPDEQALRALDAGDVHPVLERTPQTGAASLVRELLLGCPHHELTPTTTAGVGDGGCGGATDEPTEAARVLQLELARLRGDVSTQVETLSALQSLIPRRRFADLALRHVSRLVRSVPGFAEEHPTLLSSVAAACADRADAMLRLADTLLTAGEVASASQWVDAAVARHGPTERARALTLRAARWQGAPPPTLRALAEEALAAEDDGCEPCLARSYAALSDGDWATAATEAERASGCAPDAAEPLVFLGEAALRGGDVARARAALDAAKERHGGVAPHLLSLALSVNNRDFERRVRDAGHRDNFGDGVLAAVLPLWLGAGRVDELLASPATLPEAVWEVMARFQGNRSSRLTWRVDGEVQPTPLPRRSRDLSASALRKLRYIAPRAVFDELDALAVEFPDSPHPHCYAGELSLWLGDYRDALARFDAAIEREPARWVFAGRGAAYLLLGDVDAAELQRELGEQHPPVLGATTHIYWGEHWRRSGALERAEVALRKSVETKPGRVSAWMNLACIAAARGDGEALSSAWSRACTLAPGLVWQAGLAAGCDGFDAAHAPVVADAALEMMRGNRSSHLVTYWVDGAFRMAPVASDVRALAGASHAACREARWSTA